MKVQRLMRLGLVLALVLALGVVVVPAGSALAATGHTYAGEFGVPNSDPGQVLSPGGVAVSPDGTAVYVTDQNTGTVQVFDPSGDPTGRFDGAGTLATFMAPTGIAATASDLWVVDGANTVVDRFDTSGGYQSQLTGADTPSGAFGYVTSVAVDPTTATPTSGFVYVADLGNAAVDVFDASGAYVRQITDVNGAALGAPTSVAVDGDGNVLVVDVGNNLVAKFAPGGSSFTAIVERDRSPQAVAADASTDDVYVANSGPDGVSLVTQHRTDGTANEFRLVRSGSVTALAVSPTSHAVFAADSTNGVVQRFRTATYPDAQTDAATAVTATTADLNGTVDPLGVETTARLDYGLSRAYGSSVGETYLGSAAGAQGIVGTVTELQPNATYHFRAVAATANGVEYGADQTFTTDAAPPTVGKRTVTGISQTSATLSAKINPNNSPTTYHVEVGTDTTYGLGSAPVPDAALGDGFGFQDATVDLAAAGIALAPDTTYHFRFVADNGVGASVATPDMAFHTLPSAPIAVTGDATDITANSATLSGTVDPGGSTPGSATTYRFQYGTGTDYRDGYSPLDPADAGATPGAVTRSTALTGLRPSTTYHYRLLATNGAGTVAGADRTFTTSAGPPAVTTGTAMDVTAAAATLSGTVDPHGLATQWILELGTDTTYGTRWFGDAGEGAGAHDISVRVTNLAPGTTYHYRLVATNADGTTTGADGTFTTPGVSLALTTPPTAVTPVSTGSGRDSSPTPAAKKKPSAKKPKSKSKKSKSKKKTTAKKRKKAGAKKGKKS